MTKNPHAQALGRLGGQKKSEKKAAAARENGKKPKRSRISQTGQNLQKTIPASP